MLPTPQQTAVALILAAIVLYPALTLGQEVPHDHDGDDIADHADYNHDADYAELGLNGTGGNDEISNLQAEIAAKQKRLEEIQARQAEYQRAIRQRQAEQVDLKGQIEILENSIGKMEAELEVTQVTLDKTALEIAKVQLEIAEKEESIARKKSHLEQLLRMIAQNDGKDTLEVLLVHNSLSEFLDQVQYVKSLNSNMANVLEEVKLVKADLEEQEDSLAKKKAELDRLKEKLEQQQAALADQKEAKEYTLDQSRLSEAEYQRQLQAARAEQANANAAIVAAERALRKKLEEQRASGEKPALVSDNGLIWPTPKNVITAYFQDPDYPFRHVYEHPAIDYRTAQGTPVKAAASGYVAKARDNGYGYSYVMIVHADGLSTVYGHLSRIDVAQDEYVTQGQQIGLSGGMPGSRGAGYMTTGAHMHFEVRLNGIPVNPLNYLP